MRNGESVAAFEAAFAAYVGARYAIALVNGTATLHTALVALGVRPGDRVAVPPLTMSATTLAVLQAGAVPVFCDVDPETWLMQVPVDPDLWRLPVSLYGLSAPWGGDARMVDDAAQTLRKHSGAAFTSYSFQASKILALGEGGMLVTDDEELATRAREFSSLGYRMRADQPRIDPAVLKSPTYARHHWPLAFNYRMNDLTAERGLEIMRESPSRIYAFTDRLDELLGIRRAAAELYADAIAGCSWLTPRHVPEGWTHDYWCWAVALDFERMPRGKRGQIWPGSLWADFVGLIEKHGGERPYGAWRLTYQEPAFAHLEVSALSERPRPETGGSLCPVAEDLQPRLLQFQTNDLPSAERNAAALRRAIAEVGG